MKGKKLAALITAATLAAATLAGCGASNNQADSGMDKGVLILSVNPEIQIEYNKEGKVTDVEGVNQDGMQVVENYQDYVGKNCNVVLDELIGIIYEAGYFVDDVDGSVRKIVLELEPGSVLPNENFLVELSEDIRESATELNFKPGIKVEDAEGYGVTDYGVTDYGVTDYGVTDYNDTDYGPNNDGVTDYGVTDYADTDYGPNNDGVTDYGVTDYADTDYGPNNDGVTDYGVTDYADTDYGPNNDGVTDYAAPAPAPSVSGSSDYNDGTTDYNDGTTDYNDNSSDYDDGNSDYDD